MVRTADVTNDERSLPVPESRHRRKGQIRPRPREVAPQPVRRKRSPMWVPITGGALVGIGVLLIILNYVFWRRNEFLLIGFGLLAVGMVFLTQWR